MILASHLQVDVSLTKLTSRGRRGRLGRALGKMTFAGLIGLALSKTSTVPWRQTDSKGGTWDGPEAALRNNIPEM